MRFLNPFKWFSEPLPTEDEIFNVEEFNKWFNDPNNGAVYANSGIFLRIDKLSESQIEDYLLKRFGKKVHDKYNTPKYWYLRKAFFSQISAIWRKKIREQDNN